MTSKSSNWYKFLQWERLISNIQLVIAEENFGIEENLSPVAIPRMSKDMDYQLELAHKVNDLVDRANRKICVTLLRYSGDESESFYAQVRILAWKKEDEKFQQLVYVKNKLEEFI